MSKVKPTHSFKFTLITNLIAAIGILAITIYTYFRMDSQGYTLNTVLDCMGMTILLILYSFGIYHLIRDHKCIFTKEQQ